jgi:hypothetical protein
MASPAQQAVRNLFREAVRYCKVPANRGGKTFQRCVGDYIKTHYTPAPGARRRRRARRARRVLPVTIE